MQKVQKTETNMNFEEVASVLAQALNLPEGTKVLFRDKAGKGVFVDNVVLSSAEVLEELEIVAPKGDATAAVAA